jgi:hypothetical protein
MQIHIYVLEAVLEAVETVLLISDVELGCTTVWESKRIDFTYARLAHHKTKRQKDFDPSILNPQQCRLNLKMTHVGKTGYEW